MTGPYIQKNSWKSFAHDGLEYDLTHLNEHEIQVLDSTNLERRIAVTYSDHCFTRDRQLGDDPALTYPDSSRISSCFSFERHQHSLSLPKHINSIATSKAWNVDGQHFALLPPVINSDGDKVYYAIMFSLDPLKGLPIHLHMRIQTAHPRIAGSTINTYGFVSFPLLVSLRCQSKHPKKIYDRNRKRPNL